MSKPWYGDSDADVLDHGYVFDQTANYYQGVVPFSAQAIARIDADYNDYQAKLQDQKMALEAAKTATSAKDAAKAKLIDTLQELSKKVRASSAVTEQMVVEFGMKPIAPPSKTTPKIPSNVVGSGQSNGENVIRWKGNGNTSRTIYIVQASVGASGEWVQVGAVYTTEFVHTGQTPGVFMQYRIRATRGNRTSGWSEAASVYGSFAAAA